MKVTQKSATKKYNKSSTDTGFHNVTAQAGAVILHDDWIKEFSSSQEGGRPN